MSFFYEGYDSDFPTYLLHYTIYYVKVQQIGERVRFSALHTKLFKKKKGHLL